MANAARSTKITLVNFTGLPLQLINSNLEWGIWTSEPPAEISSQGAGNWESESEGIMTGTEGQATFQIGDTDGVLKVYWDNPYVGSNSYDVTVPLSYTATRSGGEGNNAHVTVEISSR